MARTLQELAKEAIMVQDASNILGVTNGMAEAVREIRENGVFATDDIARHPITQMWASKVHDLAGMGLSNSDRYGKAYDACKKLAAGE